MAAFKILKETSTNFDAELQKITSNLPIARTSEDVIAKELQDLKFFSSKYLLLHAKETCRILPEIEERVQNGVDIISEYEEAVQRRIQDGAVVKSISQSRAVQALLTTPDQKLDPQLVERKRKIMFSIQQFRSLDTELRQVDASLIEKQKEEEQVRAQWDTTVEAMRDRTVTATAGQQIDTSGPLYKKLDGLVSKMEMMRLLISQLVTVRTEYDWLSDPDKRINGLALTREHHTVEGFVLPDD